MTFFLFYLSGSIVYHLFSSLLLGTVDSVSTGVRIDVEAMSMVILVARHLMDSTIYVGQVCTFVSGRQIYQVLMFCRHNMLWLWMLSI